MEEHLEEHDNAVNKVAFQITRLHEQKKSFKIYHGTTNSTRKTVVTRDSVVDTSPLSRVLSVNQSTKTALVEPNVSFDRLVRAVLRYNLLPAVVPEFPAITVGGAIAGMAGESSSFKYGFVSDNVKWMQLVLPNGTITTATRDSNADLFDGVMGTFGSVAVVVLLEIKLVKAEQFVRLTYSPANSVPDLLRAMERATQSQENDFVDSILYRRDRGVVVSGTFAASVGKGEMIQRHSRAGDEWYYIHVENLLSKSATSTHTEIVPTEDYLFRYDRGAFWAGRHVFTYFAIPFIFPFRWLFNPLFHTKTLYHGLHENGMAKDNIIQDVLLPASRTEDFLDWVDHEYGIYPLWLCPFRRRMGEQIGPHPRQLCGEEGKEEPLISVGLWGPRLPDPKEFVAENRKVEAKVEELGGIKWLYAQCQYTEEEFWRVYDREWYDDLRRKYGAEHLPSVYEKTKFDWRAEERVIQGYWLRWLFSFIWWIWPVPGIYGVIRVLMGSDYLLASA